MKHYLDNFYKSINDLGPSRKFFIICLAFIFGVGAHSLTKFERWEAAVRIFLIISIAIFAVSLKYRKLFFIGLLALILFGGLMSYEHSLLIPKNDISSLNDQKVTLRGTIVEEPDIRLDHQKLKVSVKSLTSRKDADSNAEKRGRIKGKLLVRTELYPEFSYGDEIELTCKLQRPEPVQDFAYDEYLARYDIYSVCYRPENLVVLASRQGNWFFARVLLFKKYLSANISAVISEPYASLARGTALGERGTIPFEIQENFRRTGLSHILAISGFNITLIVYMLGFILSVLIRNKKARFLMTGAGILFFVLLVGAEPSVVRAAIMGILVLFAKSAARMPPARITLALAGALMLIYNPKLMAFDRGFLLSFAATVGIIYFSPLLKVYTPTFYDRKKLGHDDSRKNEAKRKKKSEFIKFLEEIIYSTISAIIFTTPLTLYFFKNFSLVAFIVNLLVVPITPLVMIITLVIGAIGALKFLNVVFTPFLYGLLYWMDFISDLFARIPASSLVFAEIHWVILPVSYALIFYFMFRMNRKIKIDKFI